MSEINTTRLGGVNEAVKDSLVLSRPKEPVEIQGPDAPSPVEATQQLQDKAYSALKLASDSVSPQKLAELVEQIREAMPARSQSLRFQIDDVLDRPIVSVVDENSGEMIRQLPSEEVVRAARNIHYMRGILFDDWS